MSERLHKLLARHGLGSRRELESWILAGRVLLNGKVAQTGDRFEPGDRVEVDGKDITARLKIEAAPQVLAYHKPQGQPLAREAGAEIEAVVDRLPAVRGSRWVAINPMHPGDSGLLLLTNDGRLSYALTRQKKSIPAAYMVRIHAPGSPGAIPEIPLSMRYDDEAVEFTQVEPAGGEGANLWFRVELQRADRRAAVRGLFESHGLQVSRMMQVAFGGIELPRDLPRGRHRALPADKVVLLHELAKLPPPVPPEAVAAGKRREPSRRGPAPDRRPATRRRNSKSSRPRR